MTFQFRHILTGEHFKLLNGSQSGVYGGLQNTLTAVDAGNALPESMPIHAAVSRTIKNGANKSSARRSNTDTSLGKSHVLQTPQVPFDQRVPTCTSTIN